MRKRFHPVYFLKMASELKKGKPREEIIREMSQKHGHPEGTVKTHLSRYFPPKEIRTNADIDRLLWEKRTKIPSKADVSKKLREAFRKIKPLRSKIMKEVAKRTPRRERKARMAKIRAKRTPESFGRQWKKMSEKERLERMQKLWEGAARMPKAVRDARAKKIWEARRKKDKVFTWVLDLPDLNLLTRAETQMYWERFQPIIDEMTKGIGEKNINDAKQEANVGALIALKKWDKKMDLEKLVRDCIKTQLVGFFRKKKWVETREVAFYDESERRGKKVHKKRWRKR